MKKLLLLIPFIFPPAAFADTVTDGTAAIIISTGIQDVNRSWADKLNANTEIFAASITHHALNASNTNYVNTAEVLGSTNIAPGTFRQDTIIFSTDVLNNTFIHERPNVIKATHTDELFPKTQLMASSNVISGTFREASQLIASSGTFSDQFKYATQLIASSDVISGTFREAAQLIYSTDTNNADFKLASQLLASTDVISGTFRESSQLIFSTGAVGGAFKLGAQLLASTDVIKGTFKEAAEIVYSTGLVGGFHVTGSTVVVIGTSAALGSLYISTTAGSSARLITASSGTTAVFEVLGSSVSVNTSMGIRGQLQFLSPKDFNILPIAFGDLDTGFYEFSDDTLRVLVAGSNNIEISAGAMSGKGISPTWAMFREASSLTNPVFTLNVDPDTGLGGDGSDALALITGGNTSLRINSGNNVGIGGAPGARLHVSSAAGSAGSMFIVSTGAVGLFEVTGASVTLGVDVYMPDGDLLNPVRASDIVIGPLGSSDVDIASNTEDGWREAVRRIAGSIDATVSNDTGTITFLNGRYTINNTTIPAGIKVYAGGATFVLTAATSTMIINYGEIYDAHFDGDGLSASGRAIELKTGSRLYRPKLSNWGSFSGNAVNECILGVIDQNDVRVIGGEIKEVKGAGGVAITGDIAPVTIFQSSDTIIELDVHGYSQTNVNFHMFSMLGSSFCRFQNSYWSDMEGRFAIINGGQGNRIERVRGILSGGDSAMGYVTFYGDGATGGLAISSGTGISDSSFFVPPVNNAASGRAIYMSGETADDGINSVTVDNVQLIVGGNSTTWAFAQLADVQVKNAVFRDCTATGLNSFLVDSGVNTKSAGLGNFLNESEQ